MARLQKLEGWALMWSDVADRGDFKLRIEPNAFDSSIRAGDVQGLLHHNWGQPISRQANGSMTLENRNGGLWVTFQPNDTTSGRDAVELAASGDVRGQSIGFEIDDIDIEEPKNRNEKPTVVVKSGFLKESSIVTNPAMKSSSIRVAPVAPSPQLAELRETLRYSK